MADFFDIPTISTTVVAGLVGLMVWMAKETRRERKDSAIAKDVMVGAILVLIRNQLVRAHYSAVAREVITISERHSFLEMNQLYRDLGGNGPTSHLVEDIKRLPIAPD